MIGDTIAAVATPAGLGGIAIVRVSGPTAPAIMARVFRPAGGPPASGYEPRRLYYGCAVDPGSGQVLDEVLACLMPAPHSFTREDVVELHCHGGRVAVQVVLEAALTAGARLAEPGEFTRRAFESGRLSLSQAQAVLDIINAQTREGLRLAVAGLAGGLGTRVAELRQRVLEILAALEAGMDFPEDDIPEISGAELGQVLSRLRASLEDVLARVRAGRVYREGLRLVITGRPNVGKSSLLNALLGKERAIVSEYPGTTRDVVEEALNIEGIPVVLADTAGVRETADPLEALGAERSRQAAAGADVLLVVWDATGGVGPADWEFLQWAGGRPVVVVVNKSDLVPAAVARALAAEAAGAGWKSLVVSARLGSGLEDLRREIKEAAWSCAGRQEEGGALIAWERSRAALAAALDAARSGEEAWRQGYPPDIVAVELQEVLAQLGAVTGDVAPEEVINEIFSRFCVGK